MRMPDLRFVFVFLLLSYNHRREMDIFNLCPLLLIPYTLRFIAFYFSPCVVSSGRPFCPPGEVPLHLLLPLTRNTSISQSA